MKKLFTLILGITLAYSCSTSSDGNGNSNTTVVPVAPSNLTGVVVSTTQINLSWTDNSTNETEFKIERKTGTGVYAVVGTTATDVTTFSDTGLTPNTTYTYRVYSYNSVGNSPTYSNELVQTTANVITLNVPGPNLTDIDGNTYQSVTNCGITFTKQNLNVSKYSDGTTIPEVQDNVEWASLTTGAWCYYQHNSANGPVYGKLYNWYAVSGIYNAASASNPALRKKLAPTGWHIPSEAEWSNLINCLDPNADGGNNTLNVAGGKMKSTGTSLWYLFNNYATNESGFTGLPGGYRTPNDTHFSLIGTDGTWWSSSEYNTSLFSSVYIYTLRRSNHQVYKAYDFKDMGYSVRCVKD